MCRIAWAEAYAALSRRAREVPEDAFVIEQAKLAFAADWSHFVVLDIDQLLVERAGDYADTFALRGSIGVCPLFFFAIKMLLI